jgi:hypothetical protein
LGGMKYQGDTRFEFREFGTNLTPVKRKLDALATAEEQPPSRETYIVTRLNIESNVKIRGKHLQVKGLKARLEMLEQWEPIFSKKFPVSSEDVENSVFPPLGLDIDLSEEAELTEDALLALVAGQHSLATIVVDKRRTLFDLGASEAEFCEIEIGEERLHTVAIEAPESEAAKQALRSLGLEAAGNESYPAFLQRRLF